MREHELSAEPTGLTESTSKKIHVSCLRTISGPSVYSRGSSGSYRCVAAVNRYIFGAHNAAHKGRHLSTPTDRFPATRLHCDSTRGRTWAAVRQVRFALVILADGCRVCPTVCTQFILVIWGGSN